MVFSLIVDAVTNTADQRMQTALVDISATGLGFVQDESFVAGAHEATEGIRAVAILAEVFMLITLVYVFENDCNTIGTITRSARA